MYMKNIAVTGIDQLTVDLQTCLMEILTNYYGIKDAEAQDFVLDNTEMDFGNFARSLNDSANWEADLASCLKSIDYILEDAQNDQFYDIDFLPLSIDPFKEQVLVDIQEYPQDFPNLTNSQISPNVLEHSNADDFYYYETVGQTINLYTLTPSGKLTLYQSYPDEEAFLIDFPEGINNFKSVDEINTRKNDAFDEFEFERHSDFDKTDVAQSGIFNVSDILRVAKSQYAPADYAKIEVLLKPFTELSSEDLQGILEMSNLAPLIGNFTNVKQPEKRRAPIDRTPLKSGFSASMVG